jgi:hypothetical protein
MYRCTEGTYPIVCLQGVGNATQAELDEAGRIFARAVDRPGKIMCISDSRFASQDAKQRKLIGAWADDVTARCASRVVATVVILDSAILRGALTALNWISKPVVPLYSTGSASEAIETARRVAADSELEIPEHVWGRVRLWLEDGAKLRVPL